MELKITPALAAQHMSKKKQAQLTIRLMTLQAVKQLIAVAGEVLEEMEAAQTREQEIKERRNEVLEEVNALLGAVALKIDPKHIHDLLGKNTKMSINTEKRKSPDNPILYILIDSKGNFREGYRVGVLPSMFEREAKKVKSKEKDPKKIFTIEKMHVLDHEFDSNDRYHTPDQWNSIMGNIKQPKIKK